MKFEVWELHFRIYTVKLIFLFVGFSIITILCILHNNSVKFSPKSPIVLKNLHVA